MPILSLSRIIKFIAGPTGNKDLGNLCSTCCSVYDDVLEKFMQLAETNDILTGGGKFNFAFLTSFAMDTLRTVSYRHSVL